MVKSLANERDIEQLAVNTIRFLAVDAVQKANSGHPGLPMGAADYAFVLWTKFLRFHPQQPQWPNRDRFVLSAGHGSMLLYALLHLSGYDVSLTDMQNFRQLGSKTPGHPEFGLTPGVETTTGPLGQGFGNGVGMAVAAKMSAARFNTPAFAPLTYRVFGVVSDGDLMEGVASEAASLAGHWGLGNLIYIYDDNHITIEGNTSLAFTEDVGKRFTAYGWQVQAIDGHNHREIHAALQQALAETKKPSLIIARTHIAFGSPNKQDTAEAHGSPLGEEEVKATKEKLGWPLEPKFWVPSPVRELFDRRIVELVQEYNRWQSDFATWRQANPQLAKAWDDFCDKRLSADLDQSLLSVIAGKEGATRSLSGKVLQKAAALMPSLCGGSADLEQSTKTFIQGSPAICATDFSGRNFHFGIREHGMGAILNGIALSGGWIPYGSTFFVFADYMRPAIRLAALMKLQVIYVFTHDSFYVGEDGPTHQPVEHLAALRVIPNLLVIRPADAEETALAWTLALQNQNGPTALILTRQNLPVLHRDQPLTLPKMQQGGYIVQEADHGEAEFVLIATGSEVALAAAVQTTLRAEGHPTRLVSLPADQLFLQQPPAIRQQILGSESAKRIVLEAGVPDLWPRLVGSDALVIGQERFGESAPAEELAQHFGFTVESVLAKIKTKGWL